MPLSYNRDRETFVRMPLGRMSLAKEEIERLRRELIPEGTEDDRDLLEGIEEDLSTALAHLEGAIAYLRDAQRGAAEHFGFTPRESMHT